MSDEEINQALAEACRLKDVQLEKWCGSGSELRATYMSDSGPGHVGCRQLCPNYCSDLNAMREAESLLNEVQRIDYVDHLIPQGTHIKDREWVAFHATARQRAEAFLRCLGKWRGA